MQDADKLIDLVRLKTILSDASYELKRFTSTQEDVQPIIDQIHTVLGKIGIEILYFRLEE